MLVVFGCPQSFQFVERTFAVRQMWCMRDLYTPFNVTRIHNSMSLVYTLQRHQYTRLDVTNILVSVSRLYSFVLKGYSQVCLRGILKSV